MRGVLRALASSNGSGRSDRAAALLAFGAGVGTAAITAGTTLAAITATAAAMAAATMAFATAAIFATAFTAALATMFAAELGTTAAAGALALGARGVAALTFAAAMLAATATATAVATTTAALVAFATTFAALAVAFTGRGMRGSGGRGLDAKETLQPGDETAGGLGLSGGRGKAVALLGTRITTWLARFEALTAIAARLTGGVASGCARLVGLQRIEFLGRSGLVVTRLAAGAGLDAEGRALVAAGAAV